MKCSVGGWDQERRWWGGGKGEEHVKKKPLCVVWGCPGTFCRRGWGGVVKKEDVVTGLKREVAGTPGILATGILPVIRIVS